MPTGRERSGKIFVSDWGQWTYLSFSGKLFGMGNPENNYISICYDEITNAVYVRDMSEVNFFVSDFDDTEYYGKNLWDGFTTGEVYCRVRLGEYSSSSGSFLISQYGDTDLSDDTLVNEIPPRLAIDFGEYEESALPVAAVGKSYNIFPAKAMDIYYGEVPVTTKVFTNYYSSSRIEVNIKKGSFTPRLQVDHYIEYTAQGSADEKVTYIVQITVDKDYSEPTLNFTDFPSVWSLGKKGALPDYTAENGSGKIDVSLNVINGSLNLSTDGGMVQPLKLAPMVFSYTLIDFLGTKTEIQKTVTVVRPTEPLFGDIPYLPDVFIEDFQYKLPEIKAYNYITADGDPVNVETSVIYEGKKTIINGTYIPAVDNSKDVVTVRYSARVGDAVSTFEKDVTVYKVKTDGRLDMIKYFETQGSASMSATKQAIELSGVGSTDFSFINAVGVNNFKTNFITGDAGDIERFDIILTDTADSDNVLKFTYQNSGNSIIFYVNDNRNQVFTISSSFSSKSVMELLIDLNERTVHFDVNSGFTAAIKTNLAGNAFNGFSYGKANVCYHMEGGSYTIGLQTINNQFISNDRTDFIGPNLDIKGDYGGEKIKGDTILLPDVLAVDVLTGDCEVYVSVQCPDNSFLYDNVLLSSVNGPITLSDYGVYYVELYAKDSNGRQSSFAYTINTIDDIPPVFSEITTIGDVHVGDKVYISRPTATDNVDGKLKVQVYINYPSGLYKSLGEYEGIIANSKGVYTVVYIAMDSFGNRITLVKTFEAK